MIRRSWIDFLNKTFMNPKDYVDNAMMARDLYEIEVDTKKAERGGRVNASKKQGRLYKSDNNYQGEY